MKTRTTRSRIRIALFTLSCLALGPALAGCDDADEDSPPRISRKKASKRKSKQGTKSGEKTGRKRRRSSVMDEPELKKVPRLGISVIVPPSVKVTAGRRPGTGAINMPDYKGYPMGIRVASPEEAQFDSFLTAIKEDSLKVFEKELWKKGEGAEFTYVYQADLFGKKKTVFHQTKVHDGKAWVCFANTPSVEAAKAFSAICSSIGQPIQ